MSRQFDGPATRVMTMSAPRWVVAKGCIVGASIGVVARVWMRWISTNPEFSWSGTIAIVASFMIFGTAQSVAWAARTAKWSRSRLTAIRIASTVLSLGLFVAAGAILFPTVVAASLAQWRTEWSPWVRVPLAVAAIPMLIYVGHSIVDDYGWNPATVGRIGLFLLLYVAIICATWPTVAAMNDGWHSSKLLRAVVVAIPMVLVGRVAVSFAMRR